MERDSMMVGMTMFEAYPSLVTVVFLSSPLCPALTRAKHLSLIKPITTNIHMNRMVV
jgi:hypothetical protein